MPRNSPGGIRQQHRGDPKCRQDTDWEGGLRQVESLVEMGAPAQHRHLHSAQAPDPELACVARHAGVGKPGQGCIGKFPLQLQCRSHAAKPAPQYDAQFGTELDPPAEKGSGARGVRK